MRVLALATYDSFLNTARLIAPYYERAGVEVELALVKARRMPQIESGQIEAAGVSGKVRWVDIETLCRSGEIGRYDIVLSCLEGLSTRRLFHRLRAFGPERPLVVSIYPGLLLRLAYDGFSMRAASDFFWLNSERDLESYRAMCESFGCAADNARVFGVASVLQPIERQADAQSGPIVFFEQAVIPRYKSERQFMAGQLLDLARRNPARKVLVKLRATGRQASLHRAWHPLPDLMRRAATGSGGWPANLEFTSERADRLLAIASHCITISSTVAIEALYAGVPTAIIADFGAHDDYGLQYFFGSGLLKTFAELEFPFEGRPQPSWLERNAADPRQTIARLVAETITAAAKPHPPIREEAMRAEHSPAFRAFIEQDHGIDRLLSRGYQKMPVGEAFAAILGAIRNFRLRGR